MATDIPCQAPNWVIRFAVLGVQYKPAPALPVICVDEFSRQRYPMIIS
jgi:hypothetical protein